MAIQKLLIIGAGIGQIPLLEKAKARGIHVTVASIPGNYPCLPLADDIISKDIYDRDEIVEEAKKRQINAVISDQNDLTNPTVAYVAEKLNLPGNRFDTVMTYCNKNRFRELCEKAGVPVPKHIEIHRLEDADSFQCPFPWIVKPADSQSSIAVQRIDRKEQLKPAIEKALEKSPTHSAILEEFFSGHEIVCEGFIYKGQYHLLAFADRKYFDLPDMMIPTQTIFPSVVDENLLGKITQYEQTLAQYSKPEFAIVHAEYLINLQTGEIRIVESALRGGGVYISSDLIPLATGIDINEVLLDLSLGNPADIEAIFAQRKKRAAAYVCFYLPEGTIRAIRNKDRLESFPFVHKTFLDNIRIGTQTERMTYKGARKGPILVTGENRQDLDENILTVQNTLKIDVENEKGEISGIVWQ